METGERQVGEMLREVQEATPKAHWKTRSSEFLSSVVISLPHGSAIEGLLTTDASGKDMFVSDIHVHPDLRKNGIGTRLLKSLAVEAKKHDATSLSGHVVTEAALQTRAKVFGAENLDFGGKSYDEVISEVQASGRVNYTVRVNLQTTDMSDWETAVVEPK